LFKKHNLIGVTIQELIEQIEAKKRTKNKLETWFKSKNIYYPNRLNIEQTSSEITANYKTKLIDGESIIDLTGGFGVDCFYFSKKIKNVFHCEINKNLSKIVNHNFKQLERNNITTISEDGIEYLKNNQRIFDYIYLDPSRRNDQKGKVFLLSDCLPNITTNLEMLF
jgi:16S rRNA G966 N2-methylase RsmD